MPLYIQLTDSLHFYQKDFAISYASVLNPDSFFSVKYLIKLITCFFSLLDLHLKY